MLKTIGTACCMAMASAMKLEVESQKLRGLHDYSGWTDNEDAFNAIISGTATGTKWTDAAFPPTLDSLGPGKAADSARGAAGGT